MSQSSFFNNKYLNSFYISISIIFFAQAILNIFVPIHLYQLGFPLTKIVFFYFLVAAGFLLVLYPVSKIVAKKGSPKSILYSIPILIIFLLGVSQIASYPLLFYILPFILAFYTALFNLSYDLHYLTYSNKARRGTETAFIHALLLITKTLSPLIAGFIAFYLGFTVLYILASFILLGSTIPLFLVKPQYKILLFSFKKIISNIFSKKHKGITTSFMGYAIEATIGREIWPVYLIIILLTTQKTGLIITLSMLVSLLLFYFIGKITDKYPKTTVLKWGALLYATSWIARIFAITPTRILAIDSYKNFAEKLVRIPFVAHTFDLATKNEHFTFLIQRQFTFNLSRILFLPLIILIFYLDVFPFILLFIIAAISSLGYLLMPELK